MSPRNAVMLGFIITIAALVMTDAIHDAFTPQPVISTFPDLDEVTKWLLHKEALQILREAKPDAV